MHGEDDRRDISGVPVFDPPVYRQRYNLVEKIVREYGAKKVVDFGCSEGKLISQLKNVECVEDLVGIDIDGDVLEFNQHKAKPFTADYLDPRSKPLMVSFYKGSIALCDERFIDWDVIACVEIIEHLFLDVLKLMPDVVFGHLLPKVAIITTPNSEFNVLFPDLKGFRHYDHKFEWTRAEFQNWSVEVATKFAYNVSFTGVGDGPPGTEHLGKCSQVAIFVKTDKQCENRKSIPVGQQPYVKVISCIHPYKQEKSIEECLKDELEYYTLLLAGEYKCKWDCSRSEVPLERYFDFPRIFKLSTDVEMLRSVVESCPGLQLNEQRTAAVYIREHCDWPSDDDEDDACSNWDSVGVSNRYNEYYKLENETWDFEKCWDVEMEGEQATLGHSECSASGTLISQKDPSISKDANGIDNAGQENTGETSCEWLSWRSEPAINENDGSSEEEDIVAPDYTW